MSDILDGMQGAPGFLMASFSILTRFGSLETLLYVQRGEALSLEYTSSPQETNILGKLYWGYT